MKATIEFDDLLYRRLKVEAARRGRTVRDLVADGIRHVLATPEGAPAGKGDTAHDTEWRPSWLGMLEKQAQAVEDHSVEAVRASIARSRVAEAPLARRSAPTGTTKRAR